MPKLALTGPVQRHRTWWRVLSSSGRGHYTVRLRPEPHCTCPAFAYSGRSRRLCKHIRAVMEQLERDMIGQD